MLVLSVLATGLSYDLYRRYLVGVDQPYTQQALPLAGLSDDYCCTTATAVNLVYVLHLVLGLLKDYSPLANTFSGILLSIRILGYRLFDLTPFARTILVDI